MKRRKRRIMAILLAIAMIFTMVDPSIFGGVITVQAQEPIQTVNGGWVSEDPKSPDYYTYNIVSQDVMSTIASNCASGDDRYLKANYVLYIDLKFGETDHNKINIGTGKFPFQGSFDGQGHSITGLWSDGQVDINNGLFGVMKNATVKNLVIRNADIRSNQYGGVLAAQAENSTIQNITIIDSKCKVASLGAVVGLITTGGLYGGALVGYAGENTKIYNCESRNTIVEVDTTGGVQALGGDGMYMGGLVGWMDEGSTIEYSRVLGGDQAKVETKYEVVVGALAANNIYAGGIVGRLDGTDGYNPSEILDCFSSTNVSYNGECYVSVGAGISGYAGGIAARISGSNYKMERCHYAGTLSGHLLNSILVLPIIAMEDYYLGGIAGNVQDSSNIHNCYFNWDNAIKDNSYPGGPKVPAIYGQSNTGDITTIGNTQYSNPTFFVNFDFDGTNEVNLRDTNNNELLGGAHYNKWVINKETNMPVHGSMVYAETDFPGAGTISFAATSIQEEKKTDGWTKEEKPDDELANGISISQIAQTYSDMNEEVILTATTNEGYSFKGWSLRRDGVETDIPAEQYGSQEENYKLVLGGDNALKYDYKDGDVFVAKYEAEVVFENLDGTAFVTEQCTYNQIVNTTSKVPSAPGYIFLGWSEAELPENLNSDNLDSTTIEQITTWAKDNITITKTMHLYPVFIRVERYNVGVQMQSAPQKAGEAAYIKEATGSEGTAKIGTDENGDIYITVENVDKAGNPIENIDEEHGYRFSGWYEVSEDGTSKLASRNETYYLTNVDLTQPHQYEARYQYRVRAYIPVRPVSGSLRYIKDIPSAGHFGDFYVDYGVNLNKEGVIPTPGFKSDEIELVYWTNDVEDDWKEGENILWGVKDVFPSTRVGMEAKADDYDYIKGQPVIPITEPMEVYGIVTWVGNGGSYRPVIAQADFPSATEKIEITNAQVVNSDDWINPTDGFIEATIRLNKGYNFRGFVEYTSTDFGSNWVIRDSVPNPNASEEENKNEINAIKESSSLHTDWGYHVDFNTVLMAQITADINVYSLNDNDELESTTLERKYNSLLFNPVNDGTIVETEDWDQTPTTSYSDSPYYTMPDDRPIGVGNTKTDEEMYRSNYQFVGWITLTNESAMDVFGITDLNEIAAKKFVTTNRASVDGYLVGSDSRVTETMDICPVYVPYKATFKTNFADSTVNDKPMISEDKCIPTNDGVVTITPPSVNGYEFQEWEIVTEDGVNPEFKKNDDDSYTFKIKPGKEYTITAVYEATVSFKDAVKDSEGVHDRDEYYLYNQPISDNMDKLPIPYTSVNENTDKIDMQDGKFNEDTYVFVGWKEYPYSNSETEIIKEPSLSSDYPFVSESDPVIGAMNMIPVYTKPQIGLDSNIGTESNATISVSKEGSVTLEAPEQDGYVFNGWVEKIGEEENVISTDSNYVVPPEDLREQHNYIACYDVVVTYKIPVINKDTNEVDYNPENVIKSIIPLGQAIIDPNGEYSNYDVSALVAVVTALEETDYVFEGNWRLEGKTEEYDYTLEITKPIILEPILKEGMKISIYSNLDDKEYTAKVAKDNPKLPIEAGLNIPTNVAEKGVNGEDVTPQFVGYSLVDIGENGKRTSAGLYAAGQEITSEKLSQYNGTGTDSKKRIYAVWAQIETLPEARIYLGNEHNKGLFSMTAVNTNILVTAGLQEMNGTEVGECNYDRYSIFTNGTDLETAMTLNNGRTIWDNDEYNEYFTKNPLPENWNVYGAIMYNVPESFYTKTLGFNSSLEFAYAEDGGTCTISATKEVIRTCKIQDVALNMLEKNGTSDCPWNFDEEQISLLKHYAGKS